MISIVLPYVDSFSQFGELRYALRSIEANLRDKYEITIVGDLPKWITNVRWIKSERKSIGRGSNLNDLIIKMERTIEDDGISRSFLRWYDDVYLLKPTYSDHFDKHYVIGKLPALRPRDTDVYRKHLYDTQVTLRLRNLPALNCETHLPRLFHKEKMKAVIAQHINVFNDRKLYLFQSLYFNTYYKPEEAIVLKKEDDIKAGFYGKDDDYGFRCEDVGGIGKICRDKHILNHNDAGWSRAMGQYLERMFPEKSRYEK